MVWLTKKLQVQKQRAGSFFKSKRVVKVWTNNESQIRDLLKKGFLVEQNAKCEVNTQDQSNVIQQPTSNVVKFKKIHLESTKPRAMSQAPTKTELLTQIQKIQKPDDAPCENNQIRSKGVCIDLPHKPETPHLPGKPTPKELQSQIQRLNPRTSRTSRTVSTFFQQNTDK